MQIHRLLISALAVVSLMLSACGGESEDSASGDESSTDATPEASATEEPEPTQTAEPEPTATAEPDPTPSPEPEPEPEPAAPANETIIVVYDNGTIDFGASEAKMRELYGAPSPVGAVAWFDARGVDPAIAADAHRELLETLDAELQDVLIPFMTITTVTACEAGALGWNAPQFLEQYVAWNLATQEGAPGDIEILAQTVGLGAVNAADDVCPNDTPSVGSGQPKLPPSPDAAVEEGSADPASNGAPQGTDFLAAVSQQTGCTLGDTTTGGEAELDYQLTLSALGFIESFDEAEALPSGATNCATNGERTSQIKFWQYGSIDEAVFAAKPIAVAEPNAQGSCWALTAYFDILILAVSGEGASPTAVQNIDSLAPWDATVVASGGSC
jgi:hypothetical protein